MLQEGTTSYGVGLTRELKVLAIPEKKGGGQKCHTLKKKGKKGVGGHNKLYPVLRGGGRGAQTKGFWTRDFRML